MFLVEDGCALDTMRNADVLIAVEQGTADVTTARQPNKVCLESLRQGKPLLAADIPRNRDASPDGRGCLWFRSDDVRDLSHRMAFLGSNPDFRSANSPLRQVSRLRWRYACRESAYRKPPGRYQRARCH